jgi:hypothetical protein
MVKKTINKDKKRNYIYVLGVVLILGALFLHNWTGSKALTIDNYEILDTLCTKEWGGVDMISLGNREDQIRSSLIELYKYCPNPELYSITILEPTKECNYFFNGEVVKHWYKSIGQDYYVIPQESKRIIEADTRFFFWETLGKRAYETKMKDGISKMTISEMMLASAYEDYLENGLTKNTLMSIIDYESNSRFGCE